MIILIKVKKSHKSAKPEKGDKLNITNIEIKQKFHQTSKQIFRAGLIKKLEELGIGRPSTYVSIFTKFEGNSYISIKNKSLIPTSSGKILSKFLDGFFFEFVDYQFTADLEEQLIKLLNLNLIGR